MNGADLDAIQDSGWHRNYGYTLPLFDITFKTNL